MSRHPDVLILGGGVVGLTAAYFLARAGARVDVLDKGDLGQESSWAGAGILSPAPPVDRARSSSASCAWSTALWAASWSLGVRARSIGGAGGRMPAPAQEDS